MFLANTIYTPKDKEQEREFFCDFKYKVTRPDLRKVRVCLTTTIKLSTLIDAFDCHLKVTDARFKDVVDSESKKPLVFVFGWAGANEKNLGKYADVYHAAGCDTFTYYLPTRFIFDQTNDTPYLAVELFRGLEKEGLLDRPCFFHMLSDTGRLGRHYDLLTGKKINANFSPSGIMAHQGMRAVMRSDGVSLDTRGTIMDSCPGPIPEATIPRITILLAVQWICALRDQKGFKGSTKEVMM